jgi:CheY-like chemotaxis protein
MTSRLLVADDSITIQKIVSMAFETEDVEVEGIGNGQEAFDRILEFNPDIVLADVDMPGLDGFELSAKIKESPATSAIKILLLASDFEDFDEQRYQNCGADNHISKPFKSDDIVAMVKSLLEAPYTNEEAAPVELTEPESIEKDELELASEASGDTDESEPSLEELLASVEKLSTDGTTEDGIADANDEAELLPASGEDEAPELEDLPVELSEPVSLSVEDPTETMDLPEPLSEPVSPEPEEELPDTDDDIMDQMIRGVEDLKESVQHSVSDVEEEPESNELEDVSFEEQEPESEEMPGVEEGLNYSEEPEIFAEVRQRKVDNMDDLDSTFKEIVMGGGSTHQNEVEQSSELSSLGGIVPEPEDLLERIAPGTFSEVGRRPATPEDIKENLDQISDFSDQDLDHDMKSLQHNLRSENWEPQAANDPFTQAIADEVKRLLQRSLGSSLEKEVSGLSDAILNTIREVVREVTPEIARKMIREEIEKIKKQDMF